MAGSFRTGGVDAIPAGSVRVLEPQTVLTVTPKVLTTAMLLACAHHPSFDFSSFLPPLKLSYVVNKLFKITFKPINMLVTQREELCQLSPLLD